ncbi:dual specificity protein phosphatase family protein [bacterium]|nr:dual specificity protein phosphatase family protein [bacterium]
MLGNFSYIIDGKLAGSAYPGMWSTLEDELAALRRKGFAAVVTLTEDPLPPEALEEQGMEGYHLPIADFTPPTLEQIRDFTSFVQTQLSRDSGAVLVHCRAGIGRTGTMLATYLVTTGMSADEAIQAIRRLRPGSIETFQQEQSIRQWDKEIHG